MTHALTVKQAIREASAAFEASYSLSPRLDAELLLAEALGVSRERLYAEPERVLTAEESERLLAASAGEGEANEGKRA